MNRKQIISWCLFDFANSSYSAVIAAVLFSVYYARVIVGNSAGAGDLWWGRAISMSMLFIALSSPFWCIAITQACGIFCALHRRASLPSALFPCSRPAQSRRPS
jgi:hypothetical protein